MGKLLTVNAGFTAVLLPSTHGLRNFPAGATNLVTDAEYAAFTTATTQAVTVTTSGLPDPARDATDRKAETLNTVAQFTAATGGLVRVGANQVTGPAAGVTYSSTGFLTLSPDSASSGIVGAKPGSVSVVDVFHTQGAVVSVAPTAKTWFIGATTKWPGGTVPTLTATIGAVDFFRFVTLDGGVTLLNVLTVKGFA